MCSQLEQFSRFMACGEHFATNLETCRPDARNRITRHSSLCITMPICWKQLHFFHLDGRWERAALKPPFCTVSSNIPYPAVTFEIFFFGPIGCPLSCCLFVITSASSDNLWALPGGWAAPDNESTECVECGVGFFSPQAAAVLRVWYSLKHFLNIRSIEYVWIPLMISTVSRG